MNYHTIPKCLIKDWEFKKGKLKYFCPHKKQICSGDSKSLFIRKNIFTEIEEQLYNQYVESALPFVIESTEKNHIKLGFKHYRSAYLLLFSTKFISKKLRRI